jgi:TetR/AcrR family transcriptional regulator
MPKDALGNIATDKRERVLREAALAFAEHGFSRTDMAALAKRCGIAKGSIYNYFESKDELYLYVCRDGLERSRVAVWGGVDPAWNIFQVIEHTFREGVRFARAHPEYVKLYLSIASVGLEGFAAALSTEVEKPTADRLKELIRAGITARIVDRDVDVAQLAWLINNTYVMTLAALVSEHFRVRLQVYLQVPSDAHGALSDRQVTALRDRVVAMITDCLKPKPAHKR